MSVSNNVPKQAPSPLKSESNSSKGIFNWLKKLILYNLVLCGLFSTVFYYEYTSAAQAWEQSEFTKNCSLIQFQLDSAVLKNHLTEIKESDDTLGLKKNIQRRLDSMMLVMQSTRVQPPVPKSKMLEYAMLCTLFAGGLGAVFSNLRGIYYGLKVHNNVYRRNEIPYYLRPMMGMLSGLFAFLLSNFFSYNSNVGAEILGWQRFDGLMPYIGVAFMAGFVAQEFATRLKEIARTVFAYKPDATQLPSFNSDENPTVQKQNDVKTDTTQHQDANSKADLFLNTYKETLYNTQGVFLVEKKINKAEEGHPLSIFVWVENDAIKESIEQALNSSDIQIPYTVKTTQIINAQGFVYNAEDAKRQSSIGGILVGRFGVKYGLGTCHGLKENLSSWNDFVRGENKIIKNNTDSSVIGKLEAIEGEIDSALVFLHPSYIDNFENQPSDTYNPTSDDEGQLAVKILSTKENNNHTTGVIIKSNIPDRIIKIGDHVFAIHNLIAISTAIEHGKAMTKDGDSGLWVTNNDGNKVIGMVVAADDNCTYLMGMQTILSGDRFKGYNLKLL